MGLIYVAFNLRRIFNILPQNELKKYLRELDLNFSYFIKHLGAFYTLIIFELKKPIFEKWMIKVA